MAYRKTVTPYWSVLSEYNNGVKKKSSSVKIREDGTEPSLSVSSVEYINEHKEDLPRLIRDMIEETKTMKPYKLYRITDLNAYKTRSKKKNFHWDIVRYFMNAIQDPVWSAMYKDVPRIQIFADEKFEIFEL